MLPQHKVDEVQLLALASLDAITKGHGTAEHIGAISLACNMTGALIRRGIGEEAIGKSSNAARRRYSTQIAASQKLAAGVSADRNCNMFATCSTFTSGWCRTPHNSKSAARFGILTTASRVAKFAEDRSVSRASGSAQETQENRMNELIRNRRRWKQFLIYARAANGRFTMFTKQSPKPAPTLKQEDGHG